MRSAIAIVVSYAIFAVTAVALFAMRGKDPHLSPTFAFALSSIICGTAAACAAGYSAALIARRRPVLHASIVAAIIAIAALVSLWHQQGSRWSEYATLCFMAPAAIAGGWLRSRGMGSAPAGFRSGMSDQTEEDTRRGA